MILRLIVRHKKNHRKHPQINRSQWIIFHVEMYFKQLPDPETF
jgi:hypothetical protein